MIDQSFHDVENWLKSQDYKCAYLTKNKERILVAFRNTVPTPILGICHELKICCGKQLISIGLFCKDRNGYISLGFSEHTVYKNLDDVIGKIQALEKEVHTQSQIPYLDELMRRHEHFTEPFDILRGYAQEFGYDLIISQIRT